MHEHISYRLEGRSQLTPQKQTSTVIVGREMVLWRAPDGRSHEDIVSLDLPFMVPIPTAKEEVLPATLVRQSRSTTYELVAEIHTRTQTSERVALELIMERFDKLPVWGMFAVPQVLVSVPSLARASTAAMLAC